MLFSSSDTLSSSGGRAQHPLVHCVYLEPSPPRIATEAASCFNWDRGVLQPSPNKSHHFYKTKRKYNDLNLSIFEKNIGILNNYENTNTHFYAIAAFISFLSIVPLPFVSNMSNPAANSSNVSIPSMIFSKVSLIVPFHSRIRRKPTSENFYRHLDQAFWMGRLMRN